MASLSELARPRKGWALGLLAIAGLLAVVWGLVSDPEEPARIFLMLGRFHPVVLHFPIGVLSALLLVEIVGLARPGDGQTTASWILLILGAASAVTAAAFGVFLSWDGSYDATLVLLHKRTGIAVAVVAVLMVGFKWRARYEIGRRFAALYAIGLLASSGLLVASGHYGGNLTHGSNYLFEYMPPWMARIAGHAPGEGGAVQISNAELARIFSILETRCFDCHAVEKQEGDWRMDTREAALLAGESTFPGIVPGNAEQSAVAGLMLLPPEDEAVMPPEGKPQLTPEEIVLLAYWINRGAKYPERAAEQVAGVGTPKEIFATLPDLGLPAPDELETVDFREHIWPIFSAYCVECHRAGEDEGDLRLDTKKGIMDGGFFGPAVVPGDSKGSGIYELIMMPPGDEDLQPPDSDPLHANNIGLIKRWIEDGADFGDWESGES